MKKVLITATVQSHVCQFHRPLVDVLKKAGYEIHVAARNNLAEKNGLALDFADKVFDIPFERSPFSIKNLKAYRELRKVIESENYEIISCNTPVGGILTRLAARKKRKNGTKVFYTAHGFHFYKGAPKKNWILYYPIEKICSRLNDVLITINEEDYNLAKEKFHCKVERIHGVGVDIKKYCACSEEGKSAVKKELGFEEEDKIIVCVGELLPNKNQKMLIKAMEKVKEVFPNAKAILAGNGPEKEHLEELVHSAGLENNVRLIGYCTFLEKYQKVADLSVSCSFREGLPVNIVEAMLSRNPVIGTENRGHNELIDDNENGFIIAQGDYEKLAEKIIFILEHSNEAVVMGKKGLSKGLKYSTEEVGKELGTIYLN